MYVQQQDRNMLISSYPSLLQPTDIEPFVIDNKTAEIPKVILSFKRWHGTPIAYTFGGKPLIDFDGKPMFAELAVMKLFNNSGWQARWIETYGAKVKTPFHFSDWIDGKLLEQPHDPIQDVEISKLLDGVSLLNGVNYFSGIWDVFGWLNGNVVFAECKRTKKDKIRSSQVNWLSAGLSYGLKPVNFLVVQWDFIN
jgi:hypothetical protein